MTAAFQRLRRTGTGAVGFALIPAISLVTPLLVLPLVSRRFGADGLLAVTVGQSVGSVGGIIVALGWPLVGSAAVAHAKGNKKSELFCSSIQTRLMMFVLVAPVSGCLAFLLVGQQNLTSVLMGIAFTGYGFTSIWYYVGLGSPAGFLYHEAIPRVVAALTAGVSLALGLPLELYPALLLGAVLYSLLVNTRSILGGFPSLDFSSAWMDLRAQLTPSVARLLNSLYNGGATSMVAAVAPAATLTFSAADRTQKSAFNCFSTLPEALIAWVVGEEAGRSRRIRLAIAIDVLYSALSGAVFWLLLPIIYDFLFSNVVALSSHVRLLSGVAVFGLILSRAVLVHGPLAMDRSRFASAVLAGSSIFGAGLIVSLSLWIGADGAILGVAITELICAILCMACALFSRESFTSRRPQKETTEAT